MKKKLNEYFFSYCLLVIFIILCFNKVTNAQSPAAVWSFDDEKNISETEYVGNTEIVEGVTGSALKLDGHTAYVKSVFHDFTEIGNDFSIDAWIAPQVYPWNRAPILEFTGKEEPFLFYGISPEGKLVFSLAGGEECLSEERIPLLKWSYVSVSYNNGKVKLYINGNLSGSKSINMNADFEKGFEILIGKNSANMEPTNILEKKGINSAIFFDGLLDEIRIYDVALNQAEIRSIFKNNQPDKSKPLDYRRLPTGPSGYGNFNANYTFLPYSSEWDKIWRIGNSPDILIRFDLLPVNFYFWHGTGYGGVWVTENGRLMADQSLERAGSGKSPWGCPEHMSDKQCRYSSVRIIENNDARIVINWRYALADPKYVIFGEDSTTGWGEWAEETYTIYPDGVAVRKQVLWSNYLSHEWQETIVIHQPGTKPEDNIETNALTFANLAGQTKTYSWVNHPGRIFAEPENANIQITNLKSEYKPFLIVEPDAGIKLMENNPDKEISLFKWWNHWPVAQIASDGTKAIFPDRPSHSSLSQSIEDSPAIIHDQKSGTYTAVSLTGLSDKNIGELVPLARSWINPPEIIPLSGNFIYKKYDKYQRAYLIEKDEDTDRIEFEIAAYESSPLINPCFVIENWKSGSEAEIKINDKVMKRGADNRHGLIEDIYGKQKLIIWLKINSTGRNNVEISSKEE